MSRRDDGVILLEVEVVAGRINVDKIVKDRDGKKRCPRCFAPMRYKKLLGKIAGWSPGPYAWHCPCCPVIWHDGTIKENEDTWDRRVKADETKRVSSYISQIFSKHKKNVSPES